MTKRVTNSFDRLGSLIPGYEGYAQRDDQRKSDKSLRTIIAGRLKSTEAEVERLMKLAINQTPTLSLMEMEEVRKACSTLSDKILYASYGASALFENEQIKEKELEEIYEIDERIFDHSGHMLLLAQQDNEFGFLIAALRAKIKEIEHLFKERGQFIKFKGKL